MVGSGSSNCYPLESNLNFNGARSLSPLSLLGGGSSRGSLTGCLRSHSVTVGRHHSWFGWLLLLVLEQAGYREFRTSRHSIPHSWTGPALHRTVDGFVMSYLPICSWRFSFPLQVLSFPSLLFIRKSCGLPKSFLC